MPLRGGRGDALTTARLTTTPSGPLYPGAQGCPLTIIVAQLRPTADPEEPRIQQARPCVPKQICVAASNNDSLNRRSGRPDHGRPCQSEKPRPCREEDYQLAYAIDILKACPHLAAKKVTSHFKAYEKKAGPQVMRAGLYLVISARVSSGPTKAIGRRGHPQPNPRWRTKRRVSWFRRNAAERPV